MRNDFVKQRNIINMNKSKIVPVYAMLIKNYHEIGEA